MAHFEASWCKLLTDLGGFRMLFACAVRLSLAGVVCWVSIFRRFCVNERCLLGVRRRSPGLSNVRATLVLGSGMCRVGASVVSWFHGRRTGVTPEEQQGRKSPRRPQPQPPCASLRAACLRVCRGVLLRRRRRLSPAERLRQRHWKSSTDETNRPRRPQPRLRELACLPVCLGLLLKLNTRDFSFRLWGSRFARSFRTEGSVTV